jgi:hypothetical protein
MNFQSLRRNLGIAVGVVACFAAASRAAAAEKVQPIERFAAVAVNMSGVGRASAGRVDIVVERWSSDEEREQLRTSLIESGSDKLLSALQKIKPRCGFMQIPGQLGWDVQYAREIKTATGRQVILGTDRHVGFGEAARNTRSSEYEFTLIDIRFGPDGKGVGKLALSTKISYNKETKTIEIENYGTEPVRLTEVKSEKP